MTSNKRIVLFASGSGTNAERIIRHFHESGKAKVVAVFCNKPGAGVIARAQRHKVPVELFDRSAFYKTGGVLDKLQRLEPDLIVLAGFLWLVPEDIIQAFPKGIINIHPAPLPQYGGKGMYGMHVHRAVLDNGEKESGITIHYVNENYDEGAVIFEATCPVKPDDTPDTLAERIHLLEHTYYPRIIEQLLDHNTDG